MHLIFFNHWPKRRLDSVGRWEFRLPSFGGTPHFGPLFREILLLLLVLGRVNDLMMAVNLQRLFCKYFVTEKKIVEIIPICVYIFELCLFFGM